MIRAALSLEPPTYGPHIGLPTNEGVDSAKSLRQVYPVTQELTLEFKKDWMSVSDIVLPFQNRESSMMFPALKSFIFAAWATSSLAVEKKDVGTRKLKTIPTVAKEANLWKDTKKTLTT